MKLPELLYRQNPDSVIYKEKISEITTLLKQRKITFFKTHPNSVLTTASLFFEASHQRFTNEELLSSFEQLSKEQQNSTYGQGILKSIELYQNPLLGSIAPAFTLNDQNGNSVRLADFNGKNIVLIFWASWCYACLKEMPGIIKVYEEYKNKNVMFIAVSLDEKKDLWLKAIQKNSIPFINISDLKGWMNAAALTYGVSSVPDNLLIDTNGNIAARSGQFGFIKERILSLIK
jgi:peroxiredoxin